MATSKHTADTTSGGGSVLAVGGAYERSAVLWSDYSLAFCSSIRYGHELANELQKKAREIMLTNLQSRKFLAGFDAEQCKTLAGMATEKQFKAGETIFRQRESATGFYLIEIGLVSLEYDLPHDRRIEIQQIGPGEVLGWSWLAEPYQWKFGATAIQDVTASFFPGAQVREQCARDPKLGYALMQQIALALMERLQATRHKLLVFAQRASGDDAQIC